MFRDKQSNQGLGEIFEMVMLEKLTTVINYESIHFNSTIFKTFLYPPFNIDSIWMHVCGNNSFCYT